MCVCVCVCACACACACVCVCLSGSLRQCQPLQGLLTAVVGDLAALLGCGCSDCEHPLSSAAAVVYFCLLSPTRFLSLFSVSACVFFFSLSICLSLSPSASLCLSLPLCLPVPVSAPAQSSFSLSLPPSAGAIGLEGASSTSAVPSLPSL